MKPIKIIQKLNEDENNKRIIAEPKCKGYYFDFYDWEDWNYFYDDNTYSKTDIDFPDVHYDVWDDPSEGPVVRVSSSSENNLISWLKDTFSFEGGEEAIEYYKNRIHKC